VKTPLLPMFAKKSLSFGTSVGGQVKTSR